MHLYVHRGTCTAASVLVIPSVSGSGLCGIKVKWLRIPEPETEVVRGDYVWRDPAAHQADGSCQERKVVHVLPPSLNATEVVIEFTIKEVSGYIPSLACVRGSNPTVPVWGFQRNSNVSTFSM